MQTRSDMSRRHSLETAALAGGASIASGLSLNAAAVAESPTDGETERRLGPSNAVVAKTDLRK